MINQILNIIKNTDEFKKNINSEKNLSTILFSSGSYRKFETGKITIILFTDNEPSIVIKFNKVFSESILYQYETHQLMWNLYSSLVSKPLFTINNNGKYAIVEEAINGKSFSKLLYENFNRNSLLTNLHLVIELYTSLNKHLETSSIIDLTNEIDILIEKFLLLYKSTNIELEIIKKCKTIFIKNLENSLIFKRYTNDDFTPNNFLLKNKSLILIDFEFAKKTHFYFFEWFHFFKYQKIISSDYIHDLMLSMDTNTLFHIAAREFSSYKINSDIDIALRAMYELHDYVRKYEISSIATQRILKKDMNKFLNDVNVRFKNISSTSVNSDIEKSEILFLKDEYNKLIAYKHNSIELFNLREAVKDKDNYLENALKDKDQYLENALKDKDQYLENALKDKDQYLENALKDKDQYLENALKDKDKEIKQIISDHENYVRSIENSITWKFTKNLDKLFGKKRTNSNN